MPTDPSTFNFPAPHTPPDPAPAGFFALRDIICGDLDLTGNTVTLEVTGGAATLGAIAFDTSLAASNFFSDVQAAILDLSGDDSLFTYTRDDGRSRFLALDHSAEALAFVFINGGLTVILGDNARSDQKVFASAGAATAFFNSLQTAVEHRQRTLKQRR